MSLLFLVSQEAAESAAGSVAESGAESIAQGSSDVVEQLGANAEKTFSAIGAFFKRFFDSFVASLPSIALAVVILIVGIILTKLCVKIMSKGLSKTKLELTVVKFATQATKIALYVLLLTVVLSLLGIPSTSIITVIGTAGVAIGLALQDSLSNVAGGFLLMITKPFKIGDYIITNGVEGTVSQISILHTRLDTVTNQAVFIPNGLAVNAVVVNNSGNEYRRVEAKFSISYDDDFTKAREVITDIIEAHPLVDRSKEIFVRMTAHGESAIIITARFWCRKEDYMTLYFDALERVRAAFIENGIEIPYNKLDVNIKNASDKE